MPGEEKDDVGYTWKTIRFDEVEVGERIGGGGVGVVHRGWYKNKPVALKTLFDARISEDLKREYMNELVVVSQLDHPNIVQFIGANTQPPNLFFAMELCEGSLFDALHRSRRRYSIRELVSISLSTAKALLHLHRQSPPIIHRDVKSHNLLFSRDGTLKLCDFGLVLTSASRAGTPCYMAPELFDNLPFGPAVDVYAFGMLLWEMFTGNVPFEGFEVLDIANVVKDGQRPAVPKGDTPREVRRLIEDCWAQRATERPNFAEVVERLDSLLDSIPEKTHLDMLGDDFGGDCLDSLMK